MQRSFTFAAIVAAFVLFLVSSTVFVLPETKSAVVFRFGAPNSVYSEAGLKFKVPFMDTVRFVDKRNRSLDQPAIEIIARNQERLLVDAFALYRITDPQTFYQTVQNESNGEARLTSQMSQTVLRVLGEVNVDQIISTERSALMRRIRDLLAQEARSLGIEIIDVKIRRADLPAQNSEAVFQRMITERRQIAERIRAEGKAQAQDIRAQGDRAAAEEVAKAEEESQKIQGAADAERSAVFAAAFGKDPEFYAFYRSLQAYEASLKAGESTMVLDKDSEFFRYFNDVRGRR